MQANGLVIVCTLNICTDLRSSVGPAVRHRKDNTMSDPTFKCPINLNLNGSFVIPTGADSYVAGHINPDLRLDTLDSFLDSLESCLKDDKALEKALTSRFSRVVAAAAKETRAGGKPLDCALEITCNVDPATHDMKMTFRLIGE